MFLILCRVSSVNVWCLCLVSVLVSACGGLRFKKFFARQSLCIFIFLRQSLSLNIKLIDLGLGFLTNAPQGSTCPYPSLFWTQKSKVTGGTATCLSFTGSEDQNSSSCIYAPGILPVELSPAIICFFMSHVLYYEWKRVFSDINWQCFLVLS